MWNLIKKYMAMCIAILIFIIGIGICAVSGIAVAKFGEYGLYDGVSPEEVKEEMKKNISRQYSIYALSDHNDDFAMAELKNSNFRYGVVQSDDIENVDLKNPDVYIVQNFGADFDPDRMYRYSCYLNDNTYIQTNLGWRGISFVNNADNENVEDRCLRIAEYLYNVNTGKVYAATDSECYAVEEIPNVYIPSVEIRIQNEDDEIVDYSAEETESAVVELSNSLLNPDWESWKNGDYEVYFEQGIERRVHLRDVRIVNDETLSNYGTIHSDEDYCFIDGQVQVTVPKSHDGEAYYVYSYVQEPLNLETGDMFAQMGRYFDTVCALRFVVLGVLVISAVLVSLSGLFILFHILHWGYSFVREILYTDRKVAGLILVVMAVEFMFLLQTGSEGAVLLLIAAHAVVIPLYIGILKYVKKLNEGANRILEGDLEHKIDLRFMKGEYHDLGMKLNAIGSSLDVAVEERMKSERFKTELITNVSHDIKTPLTSIISYTDLLGKEGITLEERAEYLEVISRQSARLKTLIEDLIEASKAATGNLKVNLEQCSVNVMLQQMTAEYEDKLKEKNVELINCIPDGAYWIMADGRHLQRVLDNLLGNVYKYAYPGTRAYVNLTQAADRLVISIMNTSAAPLNMTADELMQRFVQGDASRNTEGHGLGLSIAQSLTELMGGSFRIEIRGDLFTAELTFNQILTESKEYDNNNIKSNLSEATV